MFYKRGPGFISLFKYSGIIMDIFVVIGSVLLVATLVLGCVLVAGVRKRFRKEMSYEEGVYQGPAGEPQWNGTLPEKVDDYTEPRYVYENLVESVDFLPENGRIIGYRISPSLVIHSRVHEAVNPPVLRDYISRFGGKLLHGSEIFVLQENWEKVSELRKKAGDTPLTGKWFWVQCDGIPVVHHFKEGLYKDVIGFPDVWYLLILKR